MLVALQFDGYKTVFAVLGSCVMPECVSIHSMGECLWA